MQHDAIVIGGSFAGLAAATQIARARRSVCVIDAAQPRNRFAAASHGFFGQDGQTPAMMVATAKAQLLRYPSAALITGTAEKAEIIPGGFRVAIAGQGQRTAAKLVLAFGITDILPSLPGLAERWGKTVLHCPYCHGYEFAGQQLGVLYVNALSLHQALLIADWGPTTLFLNGHAAPDAADMEKLRRRGISLEPARILALEGPEPKAAPRPGASAWSGELSRLRLADGRAVPLDALYVLPRTRLNGTLAEQLGCAVDEGMLGPVIRTDAKKQTTVQGVYAAGDNARVPHNASWAAADGVTAGGALHQALIFEPLEE